MIKKIFIILIGVVLCVIAGALAINVLFPNVATQMVDSVEDQIFRGTSLSFDFNGNGTGGSSNDTYKGKENENSSTGAGDNSDVVKGVE